MRHGTGDKRSKAGETVRPELIIICAILGILLVSSIPRLHPTAQRLRLEQAAFDVAQWLRVARECAVSEHRECTWTWDEEERRMRISRGPDGQGGIGESAVGSPPAGRLPDESPRLPEDATIQVTRQGEPVACRCVRFFPDGTSEAAILAVEGAARVFTITVDEATGRVLITSDACTGVGCYPYAFQGPRPLPSRVLDRASPSRAGGHGTLVRNLSLVLHGSG